MQSYSPANAFIDEFGHVFEDAAHMPPMAGRLLGHLMICEPEHQTFEELQVALSASAGSISTMSQLLLERGLIERYRPARSRKDHLRISKDMSMRLLQEAIRSVLIMHDVAEEGMQLIGADNHRIKSFHKLYTLLVKEMPKLIDQWEEQAVA